MSNQVFSTGLVKITETFAPMIERQLTGNGLQMDGYAKQCVINAISAINTVLDAKQIKWDDQQLDRNNVTQILMNVAALKLNAAASPREVYFQLRNVNMKAKPSDPDNWKKQIEMGIEGDGNDAILSRFGRDVKKVAPYWLVREGDLFEYPKFTGLSYDPPVWQPTGKGDVIRVVYPVLQIDDSIQFYIAERDDVAKNLIAHINNNMMNETFGMLPHGKTRYDASPEQKKKINDRKSELLKKSQELGLAALDDPELQQWISPAWSEYHSREQMIIRKMRNNIAKKIPKDFGSAFVEMLHSEATDDSYAAVRQEISERANTEPIDVEPNVKPPAAGAAVPATQPAPESAPPKQAEDDTPPSAAQPEIDFNDSEADPVPAGGPDF